MMIRLWSGKGVEWEEVWVWNGFFVIQYINKKKILIGLIFQIVKFICYIIYFIYLMDLIQ